MAESGKSLEDKPENSGKEGWSRQDLRWPGLGI